MGSGEVNAEGNAALDQHSIDGGVKIFPVASCYRNRDKLRPDGSLGSDVDFISKTTTRQNTKHGHFVNERAIVLELYEEERKRGLSTEVSGWIQRPEKAKGSFHDTLKLPCYLMDMHVQQKKANQSIIYTKNFGRRIESS